MTALTDAQSRARRLYKAKGFRSAYVAGWRTATRGLGRESCPYADDGNTWRQAYRQAWLHGHASVAVADDER